MGFNSGFKGLNTILFTFVFVIHTAPFVVANTSNGLWFRRAKMPIRIKN